MSRSAIDGRGVFARQVLSARRRVGLLDGEVISVDEGRRRAAATKRVQLVELTDHIALDASRGSSPLRFINHSCTPNVYMRISRELRVEFYALREIAPGEELTAKYGETHHGGTLRCRCGQARCERWL
ncbi:MAG TPA: SET domain-containing protein [Burkholderiaceae bacterium]|nr:SET domain-containing protein [Burkholderiaceae bacterium]